MCSIETKCLLKQRMQQAKLVIQIKDRIPVNVRISCIKYCVLHFKRITLHFVEDETIYV